jgi:hypothetical protein
MFAKHVSKQLSGYCHDELSTEESRQVAEHLIGCNRCRLEFEQVKFGVSLAEQLPLVPAPDSLWQEVEALINRPILPKKRWNAISFVTQPRFAIPALVAVVLVVGLVALRRHYAEPLTSWDVARLDGAPRIDAAPVVDKGKLAVGQWLETDSSSRAQIDVASIGRVEVDPNTRIRLVESKPTEHRLELARGRMSAHISAPPKLFFVNTPSGVAEDLGCAYTLEVDDAGRSLLHVALGWVSLQLRDRESVVPAGAACATWPGIGPGTPYFEDASEVFRTALTRLDFEPSDTQSSKIASLDLVLLNARPRDVMTLWYLLSRVDGNNRARVYERMVELAPSPEGVTRQGVLQLNQEMLNRWKYLIDSRNGR